MMEILVKHLVNCEVKCMMYRVLVNCDFVLSIFTANPPVGRSHESAHVSANRIFHGIANIRGFVVRIYFRTVIVSAMSVIA